MKTAFSLARKVIAGEVAPKVLLFGLGNTLSRWLKTGNRRFEFERLYTESTDPWNYRTSEYENAKYAVTLDLILKHRKGDGAVLENGCSVGQFTALLASHFRHVTAVDFSREALAEARRYNAGADNIDYLHSAAEHVDVDRRFDVIICAEMLYYVNPRIADSFSASLRKHLAPGGILVTVCDTQETMEPPDYAGWEKLFAQRFTEEVNHVVDEPFRPYRVCIFTDRAV